jgi:hypothetical protein
MIGSAEVAGLSLVAAGCGGSSRNGVAQVPSTQRTATGTELSAGAKRNADLAYSVCMRKHGVPKFPDPTAAADGGPDFGEIGASSGVNPSSPRFKAAQKACHELLPGSPFGAGPERS